MPMFKTEFTKRPALNMLPLDDMRQDMPHLSSDGKLVIIHSSNDGDYYIFDLESGSLAREEYQSDIISEAPALAMVYPADVAKVTINITISQN